MWREKLGLPELEWAKLVHESGSLNPLKRSSAKKILLQYFDASPEKMSQEAATVDMVEMFEKFPDDLQEGILNSLVAFQLTEGCNGRCPFCLFGTKKGVEAKFSFDSICRFLGKYSKGLSHIGGKTIMQYWDSDPFDYKDGEHSYCDVYKEWRKYFPDNEVYISTTIPKGSADSFVEFTNMLFDNFFKVTKGQSDIKEDDCTIRLSVAKHNIQKVESVMKELIQGWREQGCSPEEISVFLKKHIIFSSRFDDDLYQLGSQIAEHDDINSSSSPACRDGTLISPFGVEAITITAATIFEPSGQHNIKITPESSVDLIPHHLVSGYYVGCSSPDHISNKTEYKKVMLPLTTKSGSTVEIMSLPIHEDDVVFKLGRWSVSLGVILEDISGLTEWGWAIATPSETKNEYLKLCSSEIKRHSFEIREFVTEAQRLSILPENVGIKDKLEFYAMLGHVRLQTAEYVANLIDSGVTLGLVSNMAAIFGDLDKENVNYLPEILINIEVVHNLNGGYSHHERKEALAAVVSLMGYNSREKPEWVEVIEKTLESGVGDLAD